MSFSVIAVVLCSFLFKAKKAALITPPPVVPTMPRLVEDVVPDDRDDMDIILNTTTVCLNLCSYYIHKHIKFMPKLPIYGSTASMKSLTNYIKKLPF